MVSLDPLHFDKRRWITTALDTVLLDRALKGKSAPVLHSVGGTA